MYKAMDFAQYTINRCIDMGNPISNLKLQKILYYIQGNFLAGLDYPAFEEDIVAWKHGPVVPEVYFAFNIYSAYNITEKYAANIFDFNDYNNEKTHKEDLLQILNSVIDEKSMIGPWELVKQTHKEYPWLHNYKEGMNIIIPKDDIRSYFKSLKCNTEA